MKIIDNNLEVTQPSKVMTIFGNFTSEKLRTFRYKYTHLQQLLNALIYKDERNF